MTNAHTPTQLYYYSSPQQCGYNASQVDRVLCCVSVSRCSVLCLVRIIRNIKGLSTRDKHHGNNLSVEVEDGKNSPCKSVLGQPQNYRGETLRYVVYYAKIFL